MVWPPHAFGVLGMGTPLVALVVKSGSFRGSDPARLGAPLPRIALIALHRQRATAAGARQRLGDVAGRLGVPVLPRPVGTGPGETPSGPPQGSARASETAAGAYRTARHEVGGAAVSCAGRPGRLARPVDAASALGVPLSSPRGRPRRLAAAGGPWRSAVRCIVWHVSSPHRPLTSTNSHIRSRASVQVVAQDLRA